MSSIIYAAYPVTGVPIYATPADFPVPSIHGALAVAQSNDTLYEFNGTTWAPVSGGGGGGVDSVNGLTGAIQLTGVSPITVTPISADEIEIGYDGIAQYTIGTYDSQAGSANGLVIVDDELFAQSATALVPGMVNNTTQTFSGNKTFTDTIGASNLSGTNTGDVTIGTANGLSLVGQALSLATSSGSTTGALTNTDWNTFNNKQAAGNYITALTGDGTASGPGSAALTLATVNSDVGSFGSASAVSAITVNAKGLVTAAASTSIQIAESQVTNLTSDLAGKLTTTLASANIFVGNGSNVATAVAMTGDIGISNAGVTAIQAGVIVNNDINASAAIDFSKLAALSSGNILVGSAGNVATSVAISGAITIDNAGATTYNGTVPVNKGGTGETSYTDGQLLIGNTSGNTLTKATLTAGTGVSVTNGNGSITLAANGIVAVSSVQTTTYAIQTTDNVVLVSGASGSFTATLPTAVGVTGKQYTIKRTDQTLANIVTIATTSAQTIDGASTKKLSTQYEQWTVVSDGSNWNVLSHTYPSIDTSFTPSFGAGWGTVTNVSFAWQRIGNKCRIMGSATAGTVGGGSTAIPLPTGLSADQTFLSANGMSAGRWTTSSSTLNNLKDFTILVNSTTTTAVAVSGIEYAAAQSPLTGQLVNALIASSLNLTFDYTVPIANWDG